MYIRYVNLATLFDVLCGPAEVSNYTRYEASNVRVNALYVKVHVKWLLVHCCFVFQLNKMKISSNENKICVCLWKNTGTKNIS
jgi:hypothetical protein